MPPLIAHGALGPWDELIFLAVGVIFVVIAIWGALITGTSMVADPAVAPRLWGLFPVNFLHNLVHLLLGIWGIRAARAPGAARTYAWGAGLLYLGLALVGLFEADGFGLVPLGGNDIWLHALLGIALLASAAVLAGQASPTVAPADGDPGRTTTASSPEGTVTRPPAEPEIAEGHDRPVKPEAAGSGGAAEAAPPPEPPEHVVDEPPKQPEKPEAEPPPKPGTGTPPKSSGKEDRERG